MLKFDFLFCIVVLLGCGAVREEPGQDAGGADGPPGDISGDAFDASAETGSPRPTALWLYGGNTPGSTRDVIVLADGSVVAAGDFSGTLAFPEDHESTAAVSSGFVTKRSATGERIWTTILTSEKGEEVFLADAIAVADDGSLYVFATGDSSSGAGAMVQFLIVALSPDGTERWRKRFGSGVVLRGDIGIQSSGEIMVTGRFTGDLTITGSGVHADKTMSFVAQFGPDGTPIWANMFGGPEAVVGAEELTVKKGQTYVIGYLNGTASFGDTTLTSTAGAGLADRFVASINHDGTVAWAMSIESADNLGELDFGSIDYDEVASRILAGSSFAGTINVGGNSLSSAGGRDISVTAISTSGSILDSVSIGSSADDNLQRIRSDGSGGAIVASTVLDAMIETDAGAVHPPRMVVSALASDFASRWNWSAIRGDVSADHRYFSQAFVTVSPTDRHSIAIAGTYTDALSLGITITARTSTIEPFLGIAYVP